MKYIGFLLALFVWIFANGFWEITKAPQHYTSCQKVEWAQDKNKNSFRPDESLALWILKSVKCNDSSKLPTQKDMDQSETAMAYICWKLASDFDYKDDSDIFAQMTAMIRKLSGVSTDQHHEFMKYAVNKVSAMDVAKKASIYKHSCLEPLKKINKLAEQGMLN